MERELCHDHLLTRAFNVFVPSQGSETTYFDILKHLILRLPIYTVVGLKGIFRSFGDVKGTERISSSYTKLTSEFPLWITAYPKELVEIRNSFDVN